jgi:predicted ester cyclase
MNLTRAAGNENRSPRRLSPVLDREFNPTAYETRDCDHFSNGRDGDVSDKNKKIIRTVRERAPGNPSLLDGLYTDDYVYHGIPLLGELKGPGAFKTMFAGFIRAISDFREEVMDQIAERDKVVTRLSGSGRHTGEVMGATPTGKNLKWTAVVISRFVDGKIAEEWVEFDALSFLQQLGVVREPG